MKHSTKADRTQADGTQVDRYRLSPPKFDRLLGISILSGGIFGIFGCWDVPAHAKLSPKLDRKARLSQMEGNAKSIEIPSNTFKAGDFNPIDRLSQIPSVDRLSDIQLEPTDWAYQALQSLSDRYGCIAGFPDGTYRGTQSLTRYEFAAGLNACLDRLNELLSPSGDSISSEDLAIVERLREEFSAELATLRDRIDTLEASQFSTTTKLTVINSTTIQGRTSNEADLFPRDGTPETRDPGTNISLVNLNYFILDTQFSDRSLLKLSLLNINGSTTPRLTEDVLVATEFFGDTDGFLIADLNYRFLVGDKFAGIVGTGNVNATSAFRGPNRFEGATTGPLSFFAQRNPILNIGLGTGGLGFDWQFADRASLQAVYSTNISGFFVSSDGPKGHNTTAVQLALTPIDPIDLTVYYVNDYSPDGGLVSFAGDEQLTVVDRLTDESEPLQTNAVGATLNWQVSPSLSLGGWFGYTNSRIPDRSGNVQTTNYMVFLNLLDLFGEGNLGGIYIGQPPKIISSDLPEGNNIPDFFNTGQGRSGGQPGTTTHVELFYRWQLDDNISITPGAILIFNPGHTPDSDTIGIGVLRTTFIF